MDSGLDVHLEEDPLLSSPLPWARLANGPTGVGSRLSLAFADHAQAANAKQPLHDKQVRGRLSIPLAEDGELLHVAAKIGGRQGQSRQTLPQTAKAADGDCL